MYAPKYLQLNKDGSRARLAILRAKNPTDWRAARSWGFHNWAAAYCMLSQGMNDKKPIWYTHCGEYFRNEKDAGEVCNLRHTGWYTDIDDCDTAIGIVAQLPHGRFLAGYRWTSNDERVYFPEIFDDEKEAARAADGHAERFAEVSREDSEKHHAACKLESRIDDNERRLRECIALRHRMHYARGEARELIETIREQRETLKTKYRDFL
jgi:hypothetical protein